MSRHETMRKLIERIRKLMRNELGCWFGRNE